MGESNPRKILEWYDALSRSYDELYGEEQSRKHCRVTQLLKQEKFHLLVDVGCGTGSFFERACRNYQEAIGIDLSWKMLEKAKSRKTRNVELIMADALSLPIKNNVADCIVSISLTETNSSFPKLLSEVERIGRKPSTFVVSVFEREGKTSPEFSEDRARTGLSERENLYLVHQNSSSNE